jgi:hypothetical protein
VKIVLLVAMLFGGFPGDPIELTECKTEDSTMCYWDAKTRGNGEGTSFVNVW